MMGQQDRLILHEDVIVPSSTRFTLAL